MVLREVLEYMRWLGIFLAIAFVSVSFVWSKKLNRGKQGADDGTIKQPRDYLYVGVLGVVAFAVIALIFFLAQNDIVAGIVMIVVCIPYVLLIIYAVNWKIEFDSNGFWFTNSIKKKKYYSYSSVTIVNTGRGLRVFAGKKKIVAISFLLANVDVFYQKYTDSHKPF